jgi:hypothetical protein
MKKKINKQYVSPIDTFFAEWDAAHPKTASQIAEIQKNQRVAFLRSHVIEAVEIKEEIIKD